MLDADAINVARNRAIEVTNAFGNDGCGSSIIGDGRIGNGTTVSYDFQTDGGFVLYDFVENADSDITQMADALTRVLSIHWKKTGWERKAGAPEDSDREEDWEEYTFCAGCSASPYPCRTVRAIFGES